MRRILLAASLVLGLCLVPSQPVEARRRAKGAKLRAMTFNIRYDFKNDGHNRWDNRVDLVAKRIKESKAHVVCLQEDKRHQVEDLQSRLKGFGFIGRGRNATGSGERCSIVYDKKKMKVKSKGDFWLSDTPDKPGSNTWGDKYPRKVTWALLESKRGKKQLLVLNTHLVEGKSRQSWSLRAKGVELMARWLHGKLGVSSKKKKKRSSKKQIGVLIAGDFNSDETSDPYKSLTGNSKLRLRDAWVEARPSDPSPGTFCGFKGLRTRDRIDWLLVSGPVRVLRATKLDTAMKGRWPSDHYPVLADVEIH
jgi:endonuclease/exonuclease/phosphatase family metal-dependent hydrolase